MEKEAIDLGHVGSGGIRADGLQNVLIGMGTGRDKGQYTKTTATVFLAQEELENLYGEWLPRRIVDIYADQATRKGFKVLFGGDGVRAEEVQGIEQVIEELYILEHLNLAAKNARLYGGACLLLFIDDGRPAYMPVDRNNIRRIEEIECLDRWQIAPVISEESLYDYSKATYYQIISGDLINEPQLSYIHKDRILRFDGDWLPYRIRQRNYGWGMSSLQTVYDSFRHYWTGLNSAATLLTEFDIFVHKVRGLAAMLAAGKESSIRDRLQVNDMSKSIYRGYAIDAEKEELEFISRNFGGIGEILEKLRVDIIGASKIPHTVLFGESPSGLGSTGRSEERDFAKTLADYQSVHFKRPVKKLMELIMLSKEGPTKGKLPESWRISFNPLFELNEREMADVRARVAAVDGRYIQLGVLSPKEVADARYGGSEWSMELTLDPSVVRELPQTAGTQGGGGSTQKGGGFAVPPGGRDPMNEENGTLPMDGSREVEDSREDSREDAAGLYLPRDLEKIRGDVTFTDKELHSRAVSAAKAKFKVWPSAYASGYVVQQYKQMYKKKHGSLSGAFKSDEQELHADDLEQWFKEKWVRIGANGEILGPCGAREEKEGKPKCLPEAKAKAMGKEERQTIVARKRKADPDPERKGPAKNVSSKVDAMEPMKVQGLILSDVDEASLISQEDIDAALNQWKEEAPGRFKDILEAEDARPE
jgi:phage-related protein (TIGR01555 family)